MCIISLNGFYVTPRNLQILKDIRREKKKSLMSAKESDDGHIYLGPITNEQKGHSVGRVTRHVLAYEVRLGGRM